MASELLNVIGLILDIIGIVFLYKFGLPSEVKPARDSLLKIAGPSREEKEKAEAQFKYYTRMSRYGLSLILAGFLLLLIGNLLNLL